MQIRCASNSKSTTCNANNESDSLQDQIRRNQTQQDLDRLRQQQNIPKHVAPDAHFGSKLIFI